MPRPSQLTALLALSVTAGVGCGSRSTLGAGPVASQLDPQAQAFVDGLAAQGGPPISTLPIGEARAVLDTLQTSETPPLPADVEDLVIPGGPLGTVAIRIVRPKGDSEPLPVVMYFHGGGWILGDEKTHDRLVRKLAYGAHAALVFVKYTPSPEARFPVAVEEAYAATKYVAEHGTRFGLDPSRLAVAGDSVGGNMATVVARLAKARGGPEIRYQALLYPVTDARFDDASYQEFAEGPWLTKRSMEWFFDAYAPELADRDKPEISPLRATPDQLRGLPPALVVTDENDVLRDEGEAYAHALMRADVPVTAVRVLGMMHDFMMLDALASTPGARSATALAGDRLREALAK